MDDPQIQSGDHADDGDPFAELLMWPFERPSSRGQWWRRADLRGDDPDPWPFEPSFSAYSNNPEEPEQSTLQLNGLESTLDALAKQKHRKKWRKKGLGTLIKRLTTRHRSTGGNESLAKKQDTSTTTDPPSGVLASGKRKQKNADGLEDPISSHPPQPRSVARTNSEPSRSADGYGDPALIVEPSSLPSQPKSTARGSSEASSFGDGLGDRISISEFSPSRPPQPRSVARGSSEASSFAHGLGDPSLIAEPTSLLSRPRTVARERSRHVVATNRGTTMVMVGKGPGFKDQAQDTVLRPPLRVKPMGLETIPELPQEEVSQEPISDTLASLPTPDSDGIVTSLPTPHADNCAATTDTPQEDHPSWYWDQNCHFPGSTKPTFVSPDNVQGASGPVGGPQLRKILPEDPPGWVWNRNRGNPGAAKPGSSYSNHALVSPVCAARTQGSDAAGISHSVRGSPPLSSVMHLQDLAHAAASDCRTVTYTPLPKSSNVAGVLAPNWKHTLPSSGTRLDELKPAACPNQRNTSSGSSGSAASSSNPPLSSPPRICRGRATTEDTSSDYGSIGAMKHDGQYEVIEFEYDFQQEHSSTHLGAAAAAADSPSNDGNIHLFKELGAVRIQEDSPAAEALRANGEIRVSSLGKAARAVHMQSVRRALKRAVGKGRSNRKGKPPRVPYVHRPDKEEEEDVCSVPSVVKGPLSDIDGEQRSGHDYDGDGGGNNGKEDDGDEEPVATAALPSLSEGTKNLPAEDALDALEDKDALMVAPVKDQVFEAVSLALSEASRHHTSIHQADICFGCGTLSIRSKAAFDTRDQTVGIKSLLPSVVLVGVWDPERRCLVSVGSGFIVDKNGGLIVTAAHVLFDMNKPREDIFGRLHPKGRAVIAVIPDAADGGMQAVFRYFAEVVAHDIPNNVDACVLRISARMERDVTHKANVRAIDQPEHHISTSQMAGQELRSLEMTTKFQMEEAVRFTGYNQGGEGLYVEGEHISLSVDIVEGKICGNLLVPMDPWGNSTCSERAFKPRSEIITTCVAVGGHSGGPCVNSDGLVIGCLSRRHCDRCYIVPVSEINPLITKAQRHIVEKF